MTEVVAQSCRTVYDTIIMIIHSANLNRASACYFSCCGSAIRWCLSPFPSSYLPHLSGAVAEVHFNVYKTPICYLAS